MPSKHVYSNSAKRPDRRRKDLDERGRRPFYPSDARHGGGGYGCGFSRAAPPAPSPTGIDQTLGWRECRGVLKLLDTVYVTGTREATEWSSRFTLNREQQSVHPP